MKTKTFLAGICMLFIFSAQAQKNIPKGSLLLGGDFSFSSNTYKDDYNTNNKSHGFKIAPAVGIAVKDNLFIGVNAGIEFYKNSLYSNSPFFDSTRFRSYSYGVFVRKYKPLKNNFYLFLQGNIGGFNSKRDLENSPTRNYYQKEMGVNLAITPGLSYAVNSKLQFELGFNNILGLNYTKSDYRDNLAFTGIRKQTGFNAYTSLNNFNSQVYFGFRLLLQKKDKAAASPKAG